MKKRSRLWFLAVLSASAATGMAQQAYAQTTAADVPPVDVKQNFDSDIIVTAQKRSERLQDVPMSITAATGDQLKSLGVASLEDLGRVVPGLTVSTSVYGAPMFFLRGVGFNDTALGVTPAVAVYVDQMPIPFPIMARGATLDLERVEVLKGPQGTLFGQNSTGGAVNYIAAKPTDTFAAGLDLTVGRFNQIDAEAFLSGPLSDTLSARLAVRRESRGDWQKGYTVSQSIGQKNFQNARLLLDWEPTDTVRVELSASGWTDKSDTQQAQFSLFDPAGLVGGRPLPFPIASTTPAPNNPRAAAWDPDEELRRDNWYYQFGGRVDIDVTDDIGFTSLTSYSRYGHDVKFDFDATIHKSVLANVTADIESFSQEVRLNGTSGDGRFTWMIGANYQNDEIDERIITNPIINTVTQIGPFTFDSFLVDNLQKIETWAGFGSVDFEISDTVSVHGSARYTTQDRDFSGCTRDSGDGQTSAAVGFVATLLSGSAVTFDPGACITLSVPDALPLPIVNRSLDEDNISWRASINWKPNADALVYANVTQGYKAGSFPSIAAFLEDQLNSVGQESVLAYEVGAKLSAMDRKLQLGGALFYYDYTDKQQAGFTSIVPLGVVPSLVPIPKTTVKGAEVSATLRPFDGLTLSGNVTYVDTRIDENPVNPIGPFADTADFVGSSFPNTPEWQGVIDADYRFSVSDSLDAYLGSSFTFRSSTAGVTVSGNPA